MMQKEIIMQTMATEETPTVTKNPGKPMPQNRETEKYLHTKIVITGFKQTSIAYDMYVEPVKRPRKNKKKPSKSL